MLSSAMIGHTPLSESMDSNTTIRAVFDVAVVATIIQFVYACFSLISIFFNITINMLMTAETSLKLSQCFASVWTDSLT